MNKSELLEKMDAHGACHQATEYVREHPSDDAAEIGSACARADWLIWLLGRERRLNHFVHVAARRAKRHAAASSSSSAAERAANYHAERAAYYAERAAAAAAYAAADNAADNAAYAAANYHAERAAQLRGLHRIWRDWCAGKPAEQDIEKAVSV